MSNNLQSVQTRDPRSLWLIVRDAVLQIIVEGHLKPGDQLPPEPALAEMLTVSRTTLREAIRGLETEGILVRSRGMGTFIAATPFLSNNLNINFGVTDLIHSKGHVAGTLERAVRVQTGTGAMCAALGLTAGAKVVTIDRVRTADGRPVVFSTDVISVALVPGGETSLADLGESLYEWLRRQHGITIRQGVARIKPMVARRMLARRLRVRLGSPLLLFEQVDYTANGRPVLLSFEYHVPDAFEVIVHRSGSRAAIVAAAPKDPQVADARSSAARNDRLIHGAESPGRPRRQAVSPPPITLPSTSLSAMPPPNRSSGRPPPMRFFARSIFVKKRQGHNSRAPK